MPDARHLRFPAAAATWIPSTGWLVHTGLLAIGYLLIGLAGLQLPQIGDHVALFWPPAGLALAWLLRFGLGAWPGVWAGAFAIALGDGVPLWVAALIAFGNTLGPLFGAWVLQREHLHPELDRRRDLWLFCLIGAGLSTLITSVNTACWLAAGGVVAWSALSQTWALGWLGDALGALAVGIPLLTFSRAAWQRVWQPSRRTHALLLFAAICAGTVFAAALDTRTAAHTLPLLFVPHLLLCWQTVRNGLFTAAATALFLISAGVLAWLVGWHPLAAGAEASLLLSYAGSLVAIPLLTSALTGEFAANERQLQLALAAAQIGIGAWDLRAGRIDFSPRWLALLGYDDQSFGHSLHGFWSLVHPDDIVLVQRAFEPMRSGTRVDGWAEFRMRARNGEWRLFEVHGVVAEQGPGGLPLRLITTAREIGEVQRARDRQELAQSVFQHLHEGLLITDAGYRVLEANPNYCEITGQVHDTLLGTVPAMLRTDTADPRLRQQQAAMGVELAAHGSWRGEMQYTRQDGAECLLQLTVTVVRSADGAVRNHVLAVADITHARRQLEQLERQAHFDELTRLPNRVRLAQMLHSAMQTSRREGSLLTVCYLDLDHFKPVNDRFGHEAGDQLLLQLAGRMRRSLRSWAGGDDVVARIGGDEFVLLLRTTTLEESRHAVERVLGQVCQPYELGVGSEPVMVTASIGATVFPLDGADAETLLRHADHAMYGAKQAGRNGYLFFDAEHDRRAEARFVALGRIQEALDANEFLLHFQPKVDMRSGKVCGVEALLRWNHPEQGVISPAQFLPLIENTGLSLSVGNWVLQQGIEQLARWLRLGLDMTVSLNVSARHLQEPLFARHLAGLLSSHDAAVADHLILEVLETAALADVDYTCTLMQECRALGVRFALDDFGTGYSTFTYLKRLPVDMLKIDRSFVTNMLGDRQDLAIVEGVIGLSQTFGCSVVAEGVETRAQAQRLIEIGCDVGQGNGIAAAMPAGEVVDWVRGYTGMPNPTELFAPA